MKKISQLILAAFVLGVAASCQPDEALQGGNGTQAAVAFSLGLENNMGTRAISDGKSADKLVYTVYDESGNPLATIPQVVKTGVSFPVTETITLAKGQTYTVAFWAQDADCAAYNTDDLKNVRVTYDAALNNDETRDAFFGVSTFTVDGSTAQNVTLRRPFAQINVGVPEDVWTAAETLGYKPTRSKVVVANLPNTLNLLDGTVSGSVAATFAEAALPAETFMVDVDGDGTKEAYRYLSTTYVLAGNDKATLNRADFTVKVEGKADITLGATEGLTNVPVQRNWRTNILGNFLTGDMAFNIMIDPAYENDHIVDLLNAFKNGGEFTLTEDVVVEQDLLLPEGKQLDLDLNGKTLVAPLVGVMEGADGVTLNVSDGKIDAERLHFNAENSTLTMDNVELVGTDRQPKKSYNLIQIGRNKAGKQEGLYNNTVTIKDSKLVALSKGVGLGIFGTGHDITIENTEIVYDYFGITQNGVIPGSSIKLKDVKIYGTYCGIYLSNHATGDMNTLQVENCEIISKLEAAIEVKKTDLTVRNSILGSENPEQSYTVNGSGSAGMGYGIVLAGYQTGIAYEGTVNVENVTYRLAAGTDGQDGVVGMFRYEGQ